MKSRLPKFAVMAVLGLSALALYATPPHAMPFVGTDVPVALVSEGTIHTSAGIFHFREIQLVTLIDSPQLGTLWMVLEINGNFDALGEGRSWGDFTVYALDPMVAPESAVGSGSWTGHRQYTGDSVWMTDIQTVCKLDSGYHMRADETILSWTPFPLPYFGMIDGIIWMPGAN